MSKIYQPVFSLKTGWILGIIDDHAARPLTEDEITIAVNKLNEKKIETCPSCKSENPTHSNSMGEKICIVCYNAEQARIERQKGDFPIGLVPTMENANYTVKAMPPGPL